MKKIFIIFVAIAILLSAQTNEELRTMANEGNVEAQKVLGARYYYGDQLTKDLYQAAVWFEKAANAGDAQAQYAIAFMYQSGEGYSQDSIKAFNWYLKSAEQGFIDSEVETGYCYFQGMGTEINYEKSVEWYLKAALKGNKIAQHSIGYLNMEGMGLDENTGEAIKWFKRAVAQQYENSYAHLANLLYDSGESSEYPEALRLYKILADKGDPDAQYKLAMMYLNGMGISASDYYAFEWVTKAADQDHIQALYQLSDMYKYGKGTSIDTAKARELHDKADELEWEWMNWFWF